MLYKSKIIISIISIVFISLVAIVITSDHQKQFPLNIHNALFKISADKKNIYYKETSAQSWKLLLNISDVKIGLIGLLKHGTADHFQIITNTPDKHKIIIAVCGNTDCLGDFANNWQFIYNLHNRTQQEIEGTEIVNFSPDKKLILTTEIDSMLGYRTAYYLVNLKTGNTVVTLLNNQKNGESPSSYTTYQRLDIPTMNFIKANISEPIN